MADELDVILRRTMKTLDDQVPAGYFEALPNRTLGRLEDSMHTTGSSGTQIPESATPPAEVTAERDDDSGLHDIRSLASSARSRLSSQRIATSPPEDDILASSSAGWKAVALPEPAKMISLPEIADLPAKAVIRASRPSQRAMTPDVAPIVHLSEIPSIAHATPPTVAPRLDRAPSQPRKGFGGAKLGIVGLGLAAAAGVTIFATTRSTTDETIQDNPVPTVVAPAARPDPIPAPTAQPIGRDEAVPETAPTPPIEEAKLVDAVESVAKASKSKESKPGKKVEKTIEVKSPASNDKEPANEPVKEPTKKPTKGKDGEPNFDDLLKEAGVDANKPDAKPKLANKSLAAGDFKNGMNSVRGKAQACFNGTEGTATVKLTVAPSGHVVKATVTGAFAGTPVGACVEAAVRGAAFPPWDGGPQSFGYSYLLSN